MCKYRYRWLILLFFAFLPASSDGWCQAPASPRPAAPVWDFQTTPGVELIAEKHIPTVLPPNYPIDRRGAPTYKFRVEGVPTGESFYLWQNGLDQDPVLIEAGLGFTVDDQGRLVLRHEGGTAPFPMSHHNFLRGERVEYSIVSVDGRTRAFEEVEPYPLEAKNESGYHVSMRLLTLHAYMIVCTGFEPKSEVTFFAKEGEFIDITDTRYDASIGMGIFIPDAEEGEPFVAVTAWEAPQRQSGGVTELTIGGKSGELKLNVEWGSAVQAPRNRAIELRRKAQVLFDDESYQAALENLNASIQADPNYVSAYVYRAMIYSDVELDLEAAIKDLSRAIDLDPSFPSPVFSRATIWNSLGNPDKALADYGKYIRLKPKSSAAYSNRARIWRKKGSYQKAIADYNKAIDLKPNYAKALQGRGEAWQKIGDFERAIEDYGRAIEIDPRNIRAYSLRAYVFHKQGKLQRALSDYDKIVELEAENAYALLNRGSILESLGKYELARADYSAVTGLAGDYQLSARNHLAWLLATCPDAKYRDARRAVREAGIACDETDWKMAEYVDTLAAAFAELGDFEQAIKFQLDAIDLVSETEMPTYQHRLELYRSRKPFRTGETNAAEPD